MTILTKVLLPLLLSTVTLLASGEAILKLDTLGHTTLIRDVIATKSGDIITCSYDKTIRVWDSKTGKEKRKILGQIGKGSEGMIFAIALSPDEKFLAVGGYLSYKENYEDGNIRIYHYPTGKLLQVLKSHTNVVYDLSFSHDSKYLISGSADNSAKIWEMKTLTLKDTIYFHTKGIHAVKIIKKENDYFAITAGDDNQTALYSFKNKKIIKSYKANYKLQSLAISPKHIAIRGDNREILIFDYNLDFVKTIYSKTDPTVLAYSPNGKLLIVGSGTYPTDINIYSKNNNYKLFSSFKRHKDTIMAVAFLNNATAVTAGGSNNEIYIWDTKTTEVKRKIEGVGKQVHSVGLLGDEIAWGNNLTANYGKSKTQKTLNLKTFAIDDSKIIFHRVLNINESYSLIDKKSGNKGNSDVLILKKNSREITKIKRDDGNGGGHFCYGFYKDFIISGGAYGVLKIYNLKGEEVRNLIGHTGVIWSIALDGDRLVSGSADQTIRVWDLSKLKVESKKQKRQTLYPQLNIFISKDNEYIAWTKEGFFDASKNGAKYIGYHINQGSIKEAKYVSVDKLYNTFYRPDLIQKALGGEDISSYAKGIDIQTLLKGGLAPQVSIETRSHKSKKQEITLKLKVCEQDGGYDNLTLLLNNTPVKVMPDQRAIVRKTKQKDKCHSFTQSLSLQDGKNTIGFQATNKSGIIESNRDEITVTYHSDRIIKPNLHLLALSIDQYRDGDLRLKYSNNDANKIVETLSRYASSLFEHIYTYGLSDEEVTKENIFSKFSEIGDKTKREDVFILYVAGHGITDKQTGAYFYLPVNFRYKSEASVRESGFSQNDFKLGLSKIQAMKTLTMLDTCNSGSFADAMASRGILQKTAIEKLTRATGRATIVASSKDQVALEGYKGHGVFTYALIDALKGKGYGTDNKITIKELSAYVEDKVPDITYAKWHYEQIPQANISGRDFPIGMK